MRFVCFVISLSLFFSSLQVFAQGGGLIPVPILGSSVSIGAPERVVANLVNGWTKKRIRPGDFSKWVYGGTEIIQRGWDLYGWDVEVAWQATIRRDFPNLPMEAQLLYASSLPPVVKGQIFRWLGNRFPSKPQTSLEEVSLQSLSFPWVRPSKESLNPRSVFSSYLKANFRYVMTLEVLENLLIQNLLITPNARREIQGLLQEITGFIQDVKANPLFDMKTEPNPKTLAFSIQLQDLQGRMYHLRSKAKSVSLLLQEAVVFSSGKKEEGLLSLSPEQISEQVVKYLDRIQRLNRPTTEKGKGVTPTVVLKNNSFRKGEGPSATILGKLKEQWTEHQRNLGKNPAVFELNVDLQTHLRAAKEGNLSLDWLQEAMDRQAKQTFLSFPELIGQGLEVKNYLELNPELEAGNFATLVLVRVDQGNFSIDLGKGPFHDSLTNLIDHFSMCFPRMRDVSIVIQFERGFSLAEEEFLRSRFRSTGLDAGNRVRIFF